MTVLFTDIEGSTQLTEALGDAKWIRVLRAHNAIVRVKSPPTGHRGEVPGRRVHAGVRVR